MVGKCSGATLDVHAQVVMDAFGKAATHLPDICAVPRRPWISAKTLQLIAERENMRRCHNFVEEKYLSKLIRAYAKNDKQVFLHEELTQGNWNVVKKFKRGPTKKYVNMRNLQNEIVDTSARPDTVATYFANVHWKSQLAHLVPDNTTLIHDRIPVSESVFCESELLRVLNKLK